MIEFLMCRMKDHMDTETYKLMLSTWSDSSSDANKMQSWVENVKSVIGGIVYENIKTEFIALEEERKSQECSMNCTETFSNPVVVQFKKDIGAEVSLDHNIHEFVKFFEIGLHGVVDL